MQAVLKGVVGFNFIIFAVLFPYRGHAAPSSLRSQAPGNKAATDSATSQAIAPGEKLKKQNTKFESLESFSRALQAVESMYVDPAAVNNEVLIDHAIKGMLSGLDPHTTYLPPQQLKDLTTDTSGKFGGIGVVISNQSNRLEIVEVMPNSPAARAAVQSGECIYAIDGIVLTPANTEDLLSKMRGSPGSSLRLELYFPDTQKNPNAKPKTRSVHITREIIRNSSIAHALLSPGYVYLKIGVFQEDTGEEADAALRTYEQQFNGKLLGLILDLRNNPGGLLEQAVKVTNLFIDSGIIVSTIGRDKTKQEVEYATKRMTHPMVPLVVLVNEGSASASEIVAGALQDHDRALIMGTKTFGKGSVQSIVPLPNDGGIKVTIARYYTSKGRSIQAKGITPDIVLSASEKTADLPLKKAQPNKDDLADKNAAARREADLEGHIEASDLTLDQPKKVMGGFTADIEKWPEVLKQDQWARTAFTYLRSWSRFEKTGDNTASTVTPAP